MEAVALFLDIIAGIPQIIAFRKRHESIPLAREFYGLEECSEMGN